MKLSNGMICIPIEIGQFITDVDLRVEQGCAHMIIKETKEIDVREYNIDDELAAVIKKGREQKGNAEALESHDDHSLGHILKKKKEQTVINCFLSRQESLVNKSIFFEERKKSLLPIEWKPFYGVYFSIIDKPGEKTVVLESYSCVDSNSDSKYCELEIVVTSEQMLDNGLIKRTFYVINMKEEGIVLVLLTFSESEVLINNGILYTDKLVISKSPLICPIHKSHDVKKVRVINNTALYDLSSLSDDQIMELNGYYYKKMVASASMNSTALIFDTILQKPVTRKVFYDKESQQWRAEIEFVPNRSYLAVQSSYSEENAIQPLTYLEIGHYYREGKEGYQKDPEKAIEYFEKDGSPEALYEIAHIFLDDEDVYDIDLAMDYLKKSADAGCSEAVIELLLQNLQLGHDIKPFLIRVFRMNVEKKASMLFFKACLKELYADSFDKNETFNWLFSSALDGFKPAQLRISTVARAKGWDKIISRDAAYEYYTNSISFDDGTLEFCIGGALLFGWKIAEHAQLGIRFLERSYKKGNVDALYDLYNYYVENNAANERCQNIYKYGKMILEIADDIKSLIELSDSLFDFTLHGTTETDKLARKALHKVLAIDCNHAAALNNLAWSYKNGRGCEPDYEKAIKLFERAAELGNSHSLYHLGDIYNKGLGTKQNVRLALDYWEKGAGLGDSKCAEALEEVASESVTIDSNIDKNGYAFISYSSKNKLIADSVRILLKEQGIACWMAPDDIPAGMEYAGVINRTVKNCSCLVLLLSNDSQESPHVRREVERAVAYNKPIVAIQIEELELVDSFKYYIGESHCVAVKDIDVSTPEMQKIITGVKTFVN